MEGRQHLEGYFDLRNTVYWLYRTKPKKISLQFKPEDLKHSSLVTNYLQEECQLQLSPKPKFYVSQSNTCCVDLLVTQHVTDIDAIVHFGDVCLSKPHIENNSSNLPVFFSFGAYFYTKYQADSYERPIDTILEKINALKEAEPDSQICVFYDTSLTQYAMYLEDKHKKNYCDIARLNFPDPEWSVGCCLRKFCTSPWSTTESVGHFLLPKRAKEYTHAIYMGTDNLSINHILDGPPITYQLDFATNTFTSIERSKELNKRIALVNRLKDEADLKIGVIITNPLPEPGEVMKRFEKYSKQRKHILYFITMIQTIDECKIGNFDICDAFVVVNNCHCSKILRSLVFNRPILNEREFELACGFEAEYGGVVWPASTLDLSEEDSINRRKVSDVSLALIQTRNELLERCSQARTNKWSGMDYNKSDNSPIAAGDKSEESESLNIEPGLSGIASSYQSEPLKRAQ